MTSLFKSAGAITLDKAQTASKAVERAKRMLPRLTGLVRAVTGKESMAVDLHHSASFTDGKKVWIRVPLELGKHEHKGRESCGRFDAKTGDFLCPACAAEGELERVAFHETAHNTFGSFDSFRSLGPSTPLKAALDDFRPGSSEKLVARWKLNKDRPMLQHLGETLGGHFALVANALEDAGVNALMFKVRPGIKGEFEAMVKRTMREGTETLDGTVHSWAEAPLRMQATIAFLLVASGLRAVAEEILPAEALIVADDERLKPWVRDPSAHDPEDRLRGAVIMCKVIEDLLPEPEAEAGDGDDEGEGGEGEGAESTDGSSGGKSGGHVDGSAKPPDGPSYSGSEGGSGSPSSKPTDGSDDTSKGDDASGSASEGDGKDGDSTDGKSDEFKLHSSEGEDESWEEALAEAIGHEGKDMEDTSKPDTPEDPDSGTDTSHRTPDEAAVEGAISMDGWIDNPGKDHISGISWDNEDRFCTGRPRPEEYHLPVEVMSKATMAARRAFNENLKVGIARGQMTGRRLDRRSFAWKIPQQREDIFERRMLPKRRDWSVLIGIDVSGSSAGGALEIEKQVAAGQAHLLNALGVRFSMYAHSGTGSGYGAYELTIEEIKTENGLYKPAIEKLSTLRSYSANLDGHTLQVYRKLLMKQRGRDKLLLYFTDGAMPAENYHEELEVLKREIILCRRAGIRLVAIATQNSDPLAHGLDTIRVDGVSDIPMMLEELKKRLITV